MKKTKLFAPLISSVIATTTLLPLVACGGKSTSQCTITLDAGEHGKLSSTSYNVNLGSTWSQIKGNIPTPTCDPGWSFYEWKLDNASIPDSYVFNSNVTLKAEYSQAVVKHTINFTASEGGTLSGQLSINVDDGTYWSAINKPTITENENYSFDGWYVDSQLIEKDFRVTSDMTITAKFVQSTSQDTFEWTYDAVTNKATLVKYNFSVYDVYVPKTVTNGGKTFTVSYISNQAFASTQVSKVVLPNTIETIGTEAFKGCTFLTSFYLGQTLKEIPESCFNGCTALHHISLDNSITTIGKNAFQGCKGLTYISFGQNVKTIGEAAFSGTTGLTTINFGCVETIGVKAFQGCGIVDLKFSTSVQEIGEDAFYYCPNLVTIDFANVKTVGKNAFHMCEKIVSLNLGKIETVADYAFYHCTNLTNLNTQDAQNIGMEAFKYTNLTKIKFGKNCKKIGIRAFELCTDLTDITFDNSNEVWKIYDNGTEDTNKVFEIKASDLIPRDFYERFLQETWITDGESYTSNFFSDSWANVTTYANQGLKKLKEVYNLTSFIGLQRTIVMNGLKYQVRVIGEEHDTIYGTQNKAALTFETVKLFSGTDGEYVCTPLWDTDNTDFPHSHIFYNLNSTDSTNVFWCDDRFYPEKKSTKYTKSCYSTLLAENSDLGLQIKSVSKEVAQTSSYTVKEYEAKLFPLTCSEITYSTPEYAKVEGSEYSFYNKFGDAHYKKRGNLNPDKAWTSYSTAYSLSSPYTKSQPKWQCGVNSEGISSSGLGSPLGMNFAFCI